MHCGIFSSIPSLYPKYKRNMPNPVMTTKNISRQCPISPGEQYYLYLRTPDIEWELSEDSKDKFYLTQRVSIFNIQINQSLPSPKFQQHIGEDRGRWENEPKTMQFCQEQGLPVSILSLLFTASCKSHWLVHSSFSLPSTSLCIVLSWL